MVSYALANRPVPHGDTVPPDNSYRRFMTLYTQEKWRKQRLEAKAAEYLGKVTDFSYDGLSRELKRSFQRLWKVDRTTPPDIVDVPGKTEFLRNQEAAFAKYYQLRHVNDILSEEADRLKMQYWVYSQFISEDPEKRNKTISQLESSFG